jgi:hypothetical protein
MRTKSIQKRIGPAVAELAQAERSGEIEAVTISEREECNSHHQSRLTGIFPGPHHSEANSGRIILSRCLAESSGRLHFGNSRVARKSRSIDFKWLDYFLKDLTQADSNLQSKGAVEQLRLIWDYS